MDLLLLYFGFCILLRIFWEIYLHICAILNVRFMKTLLKIIVLAVLICTCVASFKLCFSHKLPNRNRGLFGAREMLYIDNLFVGSSMFRKGLDMRTIEEKLGDKSYILSYNGNQPVAILFELKHLFKSGVKVKNLYVDMYALSLFAKPSLSDERLIWDLSPGENFELFRILSAIRNDKFKFAYSYFLSSNMCYLASYPISNYLISKRYRKGATTKFAFSAGMTQKEADFLDLSYLDDFPDKPNCTQVDAVAKIAKLASDMGIDLTFVDTIKYKGVYETQKYKSMISAYERILKRLSVKYVRFSDGLFTADSSNFSDGVHLSGKGARKFTLLLCEELSKKMKR